MTQKIKFLILRIFKQFKNSFQFSIISLWNFLQFWYCFHYAVRFRNSLVWVCNLEASFGVKLRTSMRKQRNWVFATNSDFLIPISLDSNLVKPLTFQTMTSVKSYNISLKYQRFTTLGSKDIGMRKTEFVARIQWIQLLYRHNMRIIHSIKKFIKFGFAI